jgi:hypothetical protein
MMPAPEKVVEDTFTNTYRAFFASSVWLPSHTEDNVSLCNFDTGEHDVYGMK